jgi:hypothetical protein
MSAPGKTHVTALKLPLRVPSLFSLPKKPPQNEFGQIYHKKKKSPRQSRGFLLQQAGLQSSLVSVS